MKIKAPKLTPGKRAILERTKEWLTSLVKQLTAKKAQLDKLVATFEEAESRKHKFERDAALNSDAALNLAGAQTQVSRLQPEIDSLRKSLEGDSLTATRQANSVRSNDVRDLLFPPLVGQLRTAIETAISPFFEDGWEKGYASQIVERTKQYRQISFYLKRPPVVTDQFDEAKRELETLIDELGQILDGETLIEV